MNLSIELEKFIVMTEQLNKKLLIEGGMVSRQLKNPIGYVKEYTYEGKFNKGACFMILCNMERILTATNIVHANGLVDDDEMLSDFIKLTDKLRNYFYEMLAYEND